MHYLLCLGRTPPSHPPKNLIARIGWEEVGQVSLNTRLKIEPYSSNIYSISKPSEPLTGTKTIPTIPDKTS